jgi:hypothetical protein
MRSVRIRARRGAGLWLGALALLLAAPTARAQQANYSLPKQPTGQVGNTYYYAVPLGFTWDHFAYIPNHGDWNVGLNDSGFDAGPIPGNPQFCGPRGEACPSTAGPEGPAFLTINNDPTHGFTNIPILIGPTQDGFNNVQIAMGQSIPVVPGRYTALYLTNTQINGPRNKLLALNYRDGTVVSVLTWADWCAPAQSPPDFFTWAPFHRLRWAGNSSATDNNSCALITKYVRVDPNRILTSITIGADSPDNGGGINLPGQTITGANGRTVIGSVTLASTDSNLGGYGFVSGKIVNASGQTQTTPSHVSEAATGFDVFVLDPPLGNYGAGANVDGSYTLGLPAGTYVLSAALRAGDTTSQGPQATPITVTVTAGQTTVQNITLLDSPNPDLWGELTGTVKDAAGNPVQEAAILFSNSATGPFAARALANPDGNRDSKDGITPEDGAYAIPGLYTGKPVYVMAAGTGFASAAPVQANLTPGGSATLDLTVVPRAVGRITGTLVTPDGAFGGIGVPVTLSTQDFSQVATTIALPALEGTGRVPITDVKATFQFDEVPAGEYTLTLPASAVQGSAVSTRVTVSAGQTATPTLTLTYPAWSEGAPDATISDALTGAALDKKWIASDIGAVTVKGSVTAGSSGLTVMANGFGWDLNTADDTFHYLHQSVPAGDWVAYATVTAVPTAGSSASSNTNISPGGQAGLMVSSGLKAAPRAANFVISATNGEGVVAQGRLADGTVTFPYGETAAGTDASQGGTQPALPLILKLRKVGSSFAGFYSTDGGKTQRLIGHLSPQFDPAASLLLGLATTSNTDGTLDRAVYQNFTFAPLP